MSQINRPKMQQSGENKLLQKYRAGEYTPEQQVMVAHYIIYVGIAPQKLLAMQFDLDQLRSRTVGMHIGIRKMILLAKIVTVAATIAILLAIGTLILTSDSNQPAAYASDMNPGSDKAILTFANGTKINFNDSRSGSLFYKLDIEVIKAGDGTQVYKVASKLNTSGCNTITILEGSLYKIILLDCTRGWLNAASSLSYSTSLRSVGVNKKYI